MSLTYTTYINTIANLLVQTTSDVNFTTVLPSGLDYAELRCYRDLDLLNTLVTQTTTLPTGSRDFSLPSTQGTFVVVERINVITPATASTAPSGTINSLVPVSKEYLDFSWPSSNGSTVPQYFAMRTQTTVLLGPWPDAAYLVEVAGTVRPQQLSTSNVTTLLSTYFPDLLIAASMIWFTGWQRDFGAQVSDPAAGSSWEMTYQNLLKSALVEETRKKFGSEGWSSKQPDPLATPQNVVPTHKIQIRPGFNSQLSQTANEGGWFSSNLVRWKSGLLEKVGGWKRLFSSATAGIIRALHGWEDLQEVNDLLIATDGGLQLYASGGLTTFNIAKGGDQLQDGTTANFSTTSGSKTVTIYEDILQVDAGDTITTSMNTTFGGINIPSGTQFTVTSVSPGAISYTFDLLVNATSTQTHAEDPQPVFLVTAGSATVQVTLVNHGLSNGNFFTVEQATVCNVSISGSFTFFNIAAGAMVGPITSTGANTFTFSNPSPGSWNQSRSIREGATITSSGSTVTTSYVNVLNYSQVSIPGFHNWFLDNLGQNGLILASGGPLYVFMPPPTSPPFITNAGNPGTPQDSNIMFVAMPQAQVIVCGTETVLGSGVVDPLLIRFSDAGSYTSWTATVSNQAGSYRLSRGSIIVGGIQAPQTTLVWTDIDIWSMSYIGPPLVYGFTVMGTGCGIVGPYARATLGRTTYWQGQNSFWTFGDTGVQPLNSPVWDIIFTNLNRDSATKCIAGSNSSFHEVWFFFPSANGLPTWSNTKGAHAIISGKSLVVTCDVTTVNIFGAVIVGGSHSKGKWYFEAKFTSASLATGVGIANANLTLNQAIGADSNGWGCLQAISTLYHNGVLSPSVTAPQQGDIIQVAWDADAGNLWFGLNNVWQASGDPANGLNPNFTGVTGTLYPAASVQGDGTFAGQVTVQAYTYSPPTGFSTWGATECDSYVKYNTAEGLWDYGTLSRTAWIDDNVLGPPLGGDLNYIVQQHEMGYDDDTSAMSGVFAETGYTEIADGDQINFIDFMISDLKWFGSGGSVDLKLNHVNYPGDTQVTDGPYTITPTTEYINLRTRAREISMRLEWAATSGFSARVEAIKFRVAPTGRRP